MTLTLVTGGCGFIGRHVVAELAAAGREVRVLDALIPQVHDQSGAPDLDAEVMTGDVRDAAAVERALDGVDEVVHLAAEVGVGQSMYEIARYVEANDLGTARLLEAMIDRRPRRVVVASSMSIYGEGTYATPDGTLVEDARRSPADVKAGQWAPKGPGGEPLSPRATNEEKRPDLASIYALTKYAQERATLIWGSAYEVPAVALRLFNVFGAGQALGNPYTGVLANFASRIASGARPTIFEDGEQKRDFVHVDDVARAFRLALDAPDAAGEAINIGSGSSYSVSEVARLLAEAMDRPDLAPEILGRSRTGDIRNCYADIGKARRLLGFEPKHLLQDSLDPFVAWVAGETVVDRGAEMRRHLEERRLVS